MGVSAPVPVATRVGAVAIKVGVPVWGTVVIVPVIGAVGAVGTKVGVPVTVAVPVIVAVPVTVAVPVIAAVPVTVAVPVITCVAGASFTGLIALRVIKVAAANAGIVPGATPEEDAPGGGM